MRFEFRHSGILIDELVRSHHIRLLGPPLACVTRAFLHGSILLLLVDRKRLHGHIS